MKSKKILSFICMLLAILFVAETVFVDETVINVSAEAAGQEIVEISSVEDFMSFVDKCSLDAWSKGKKVLLKKDIDLSNSKNIMVPYFAGEFDGNGFVIRNLVIKSRNSYCGLFSKTTEDAVIKNLKIEATIKPSGDAFDVGGIVGKNSGTISACEFKGVVEGYNYVGQIAGYNAKSGIISNCRGYGKLFGKYYSGGIAGANAGSILDCKNRAYINTEYRDNAVRVEDIKLEQIVAGVMNYSEDVEEDMNPELSRDVPVDMGGIAGYNTGLIKGCENSGTVGCLHIGYNVGGIAGRQSGYIIDCRNNGIVQGRKDIGGICGQAEPFFDVEDAETIVDKLSDRINKLHSSVDRAITDTNDSNNVVSDRLNVIKEYTDNVIGDGEYVVDRSTKSDGPFDKTDDANRQLTDAIYELENVVGDLDYSQYMSGSQKKEFDQTKKKVVTDAAEVAAYYNEFKESDTYKGIYQKCISEGLPESDAKSKADAYALQIAMGKYEAAHGVAYTDTLKNDASILSGIVVSVAGSLSGATKADAQKAKGEINRATNSIRSIVDEINSGGYKEHASSLVDNLKEVSDNLGILNTETKDSSDKISSDLKAVNDDFNDVMMLFADAVNKDSDEEREKIFSDESDEVAENSVDSTICNCKNSADISGDINVSGITGAMDREYDFDLEGEWSKIDDASGFSRFHTKCVLRDNTNVGDIEAQKSYVGGVVGYQQMGTVLKCNNYGKVTSNSGDYVGGIAGQSFSSIRNCFEKSLLAGGDFVGGITGCGTKIKNCIAMPVVCEGKAFVGAIAGEDNNDEEYQNNFFVSESLAGIDRVSYVGKAEPISFSELEKKVKLPNEFYENRIRFVVDEEKAGILIKNNGQTVSVNDYPIVDSSGGEVKLSQKKKSDVDYIVWDNIYEGEVFSDMELTGTKTRYTTTLASEQLRSKQSVVLVDGKFYSGDKINVSTKKVEPFEEVFEIDLPDDGEKTHLVRYMMPEDIDAVDVFVKGKGNGKKIKTSEGEFVEVETSTMGRYITFEAPGDKITFGVCKMMTQRQKVLYFVSTAILIIVIGITVIIVMRVKKKKENADNSSTSSDD